MTCAQHLIENAIYALKEGKDPEKVLDYDYNKEMLKLTGIEKNDVLGMAYHVVYTLYDGCFPE